MKLKFMKLNDNAVIPTRATSGSAGMDICACLEEDVVLAPGDIKMIPTGLKAETDCTDAAMLIYPRSGLASKHGIALANCVGVIDSDFRGEWFIPLINHGKHPFTVENGMRIAQIIPTRVLFPEIEICESLSETERGSGGFGSTGSK